MHGIHLPGAAAIVPVVIIDSLTKDPAAFAEMTGWLAKPEGLCKGPQCVPLPPEGRTDNGDLNVTVAAQRLGMPLVHDIKAERWALGPESGGRVLSSAEAPNLILPDARGNPFELASLKGRKVLLLAWASW